ncbi:hypothetical protein [Streptomyces eurocidicus]|uniref:Uncharacterized protein n=1 Tax=Streptomyces eurocidicus TaxID=66423 RepID=A0A7W8F4K9_STREU|nr:hypothetical protein [Streptomyces eurocidicus]MBB5121832.1 hypothetical protein [Streptomyces eurocidicus]
MAWRTEFLEILAREGERRHSGQRQPVAPGRRARARNRVRADAADRHGEGRRGAGTGGGPRFAGRRTVGRAGLAAREHGVAGGGREECYEVCHAEDDDLVRIVHHPRPAQDIAGGLRALAQQVPWAARSPWPSTSRPPPP